MKKITLIVLAVILCVSAVAVPVSAATPRASNVHDYDATLSISSTGMAYISIDYIGSADITTSVTVTTKLQKKTLGLFWTTVDIGESGNVWVDTSTSYRDDFTHTLQLESTGKYRIVSEFTFSGTGGPDDVLELTSEAEY